MTGHSTSPGGENFSLRDILVRGRRLGFDERTAFFSSWIQQRTRDGHALYRRRILSHPDRQVTVLDARSGHHRPMLMFGSNNYLGLANHPHVQHRVKDAIDRFGVGLGGPPLLNGYTALHHQLEQRLAAFKGKQDALVFSSGYGANVGLISALLARDDLLLHDAYSHASLHDGLKLAGATALAFRHNDTQDLNRLLEAATETTTGQVFVAVEGVYSMDGDLARLDAIAPVCRRKGALLVLDDAHGTGVLGPGGQGTDAHYGLQGQVDIAMGTFSKAFGMVGGFVAASEAVVDYLRYFARSYFFSASLPPVVVAAVLGCLEVLEREPEHRLRLHANVSYLARGLRRLGFGVSPASAIVALRAPVGMNVRRASLSFHERGIFLNAIEYPAVSSGSERFRLSVMASHTESDLDRLLAVIEEVWALHAPEHDLDPHATASNQ